MKPLENFYKPINTACCGTILVWSVCLLSTKERRIRPPHGLQRACLRSTPASVNGVRKNFILTGAKIYAQLQRANPNAPQPTFGLRVIKPGEFEGNGGAPTTTWMLDKPNSGSRFFTIQNNCSLITMQMPSGFVSSQAVGNRLIWEMQSNWSPADRVLIRKVVLTGFRFVP